MAIDLQLEKSLALTPQDIYDIFDFSTQAAYDDGFMNSYIFERSLIIFAAIKLLPEYSEEVTHFAAQNINDAWLYLLENDIAEELTNSYEKEINYLADYGIFWFNDYTKYAHSARGLLNTIQTFTGDIVTNAAKQFKEVNDGSGIQEVLEIADKYGMNNGSAFIQEKEVKENSEDSLFE